MSSVDGSEWAAPKVGTDAYLNPEDGDEVPDDIDLVKAHQISREVWLANGIDAEEVDRIEQEEEAIQEVYVPHEKRPESGFWRWVPFDPRLLWKFTGPGWLMSIAYLDPGNLEADLQSGAYAGYQLLWMLFWATMGGLMLQVMAARLGVVTGKNLAQICRLEYSRPTSILLWLMTETAIIGSDIQEVVGSAIAIKLLFGLPLWAGCLITGFDTFTFLVIHYFGVRKLEAFFAALIFTMMVCFFINFAVSTPQWGGAPWAEDGGGIILGTVIPTAEDYAVIQAVGILGAVIMPHNIYLHSALVQSRKIDRSDKVAVAEANKYNAIESTIALLVSYAINAAVVTVFAKGFFNKQECARPGWDELGSSNLGCYPHKAGEDIDYDSCPNATATNAPLTCQDGHFATGHTGLCCSVGLQNAGTALEGLLGSGAKYIWGIGLLAAGQASTMTGTFAGQFVMEGFLNWKVTAWVRVAITRSIALGPAIAVGLYMASHSRAGDVLNEWLNILQSVQLPFALLPVLHFTSSPRIMGTFANHGWISVMVWILAVLVVSINIYLVVEFVTDPSQSVPHTWWFYTIVGILGVLYFAFIAVVIKRDILAAYRKVVKVVTGLGGKGGDADEQKPLVPSDNL